MSSEASLPWQSRPVKPGRGFSWLSNGSASHTFSAMFRCLARLACALLLLVPHAEAARVADSLVRIQATSQEPNYRAPWSAGEVSSGVGAGFIINGHRILTNAHVVSNARFLAVSKEGDPKPYPARVVHIGTTATSPC